MMKKSCPSALRLAQIVSFFLLLSCLPSFMMAQGGKVRTPEKLGQDSDVEAQDAERDRVAERTAWWARRYQTIPGHTPAEMRTLAYQQKMQLRLANQQRWQAEAAARANQSAKPSATTSAAGTSTTAAGTPASAAGGILPSSTPAFTQSWTHLGPRPIGPFNSGFGAVTGRVQAVTFDQGDTTGNTVYVGAAYGGVWKSTNAADSTIDNVTNHIATNVTWTPLIDDQVSLAANAIAIKPGTTGSTAVVIVGTGEPDFGGDSYYGQGILRSADGGATWSHIPSATSGQLFHGMGVSKIAFSTVNPDLVVAGFSNGTGLTYGSNPGGNQGIYFSTNAGVSWTKANVPAGDTITGSVTDVAFSTQDSKFYAVFRKQGVYASSDGQTWTRLAAQPSALVAGCDTGSAPSCAAGRGALAVRGNFVYYIGMDAALTVYKGMWRYSISGAAWTQLDTSTITTTQGFYDLYLFAAPNLSNSANTDLYIGTVDIFKCTSANTVAANGCGAGAVNLTKVYATTGGNPLKVHPDQHAMDFLANGSRAIVGNDGGVNRMSDPANATVFNSWQNLNLNIGSLSEFNQMSQHPTDDSVMIGGLQDNGTPSRDSANYGTNQTTWVPIEGGDGGYNAINQTDTTKWYSAFVYITITQCPVGDTSGGCILGAGNPVICSAKGVSYLNPQPCVNGGQNIPDEGAFYTPYILDPANQSKIIIGTCRVWRGNADGTSWGASSFTNILSNQLPGNTATTACTSSATVTVNALAAGGPTSGGNSQVVYAGLTSGDVWRTTNAAGGASTWSLAARPWPSGTGFQVGSVYVAPTDATGQTVYATIQGFFGSSAGHIWKSTNAGTSWTDISGDIPDVPADSIVLDPGDATNNTIYVGTDLGVYYTTDGGTTWVEYGPITGSGSFPNAPITTLLAFNVGSKHLLRASSYGRGVWENTLHSFASADYSLAVTGGSPATLFPSTTTSISATATALNGYSGTVTLSCTAGTSAPPSTCNPSSGTVGPTQSFTMTVGDTTPGVYSFNIHGTDGTIAHNAAVTLNVVDFNPSVASPTSGSVNRGGSTTATFTVTSVTNYAGALTLSCGSLPANTTCTFSGVGVSGNTLTLTAGGAPTVTVTIQTTTGATAATTPITFGIAATTPSARSKTVNYSLTINSALANADLSVGTVTQAPVNPVAGNTAMTYTFTVTNNGPDTAHNASITYVVPAGYTFTATGSGPSCTGTSTVVCNAGTIAPAGTANFTFKATAGAVNATVNTFTASADEPDNTAGNNAGTATTNVKDYTLTVSNTPITVFPASSLNLTGSITSLFTYANSIAISCGSGAPSTCTPSPASLTPPSNGTSPFTVAVTNTTSGNFSFNVHTVGSDPLADTKNFPVTVNVVDFTVGNLGATSGSVNRGASISTTFDVTSVNSFAGALTLSCGSLPANTSCSFAGTGVSGTTLTIAANATVTVTVTITTTTAATAATTNITFKAAATVPSARTVTSANYALTINSTIANADLSITGPQSPANPVSSGNVTYNLTVASAGPNPATAVTVTSNTPAGYTFVSATPSVGSCNAALPVSCNLGTYNSGDSHTIAVVLTPVAGSTGVSFTVSSGTADNTAGNNTVSYTTTTPDYTLVATNSPITSFPSVAINLNGSATASNGYASAVTLNCTVGVACSGSVTPTNTFSLSSTAPASTGGTSVTLQGVGADAYAATHTTGFTVNVVDFGVTALASSGATVNNGASSSTTFSVSSTNSYAGTLALSCPGLPANGVTCTFSGSGVSGNNLTLAAGGNVTVTVLFQSTSGTGGTTANATTVDVAASTPSARSKSAGTYTLTLSGTNANADVSVLSGTQSPANPVAAAANVTYPFTISNAGPNPATNVTLSYPLPAGYGFISATPSAGSCSGTTTVSCNVGTINSSGSATVSIVAKANVAGTSTSTATISASEDSTAGNNTANTSTTVPDYSLAATNSPKIAFPGQSSVSLTGTATAISGYASVVNLSCTGAGAPVCAAASVTPSGGGAAWSVSSTAPGSTGNVTFNIHGVGTDADAATHNASFTMDVVDFTESALSSSSAAINRGAATAPITFTVDSVNNYAGTINMACTGLPANTSCVFTPSSFSLTAGGSQAVSLTITSTTAAVAGGPTAVSVNATASVPAARTKSQTFSLTLNAAAANADLDIVTGAGQAPGNNVANGTNVTYTMTIANGGPDPAHNVSVSYALPVGYTFVTSTPASAGTSTRTFALGTINSGANTGLSVTVTPAPGTVNNSFVVSATEPDGTSANNTQTFSTAVADYTLAATNSPITAFPSMAISLNGSATAVNGFSSAVTLTCATVTCSGSVTPTNTYSLATTAPSGTGTVNATVNGSGSGVAHSATYSLQVVDFTLGAPSPSSVTTLTTGTSQTINMTVSGVNGYTGTVTMSCSGLPSGATCNFTPASFNASASQAVTLTITTSGTAAGNSSVTINADATVPAARNKNQTLALSVGSFSLTPAASPSTMTVTAGNSATYTVSITGTNWGSAVALSCSGLPTLSNCSFSPTAPTPNSTTVTSTLTISTTKATAAQPVGTPLAQNGGWTLGTLALMLPMFGAVLIGFSKPVRSNKRARTLLWLGLILLLVVVMPACGGGGGGSGSGGGTHTPGTTAGTYPITITGTSGGTTQTTSVQLVVQ